MVFTNNELVREKYSSRLDITFVDGQYIDVLKLVRDMVHKGCKVVTHPLAGSIKPNETPYRSIIIEEGMSLDVNSLTIIESSIASCLKFMNDNKVPNWSGKVLEDFRFVDLRLFESALDSIIS
ncbi:MAG: GrdX family protein [Caulobacteraceae bacterium]